MLAPWVSYCRIGDFAVFLDVRRNRYRAMAWEAAQPLIGAPGAPPSPRMLDKARALGWLDERSDSSGRQPPQRGQLEEPAPEAIARAPSPRDLARALWSLSRARAALAARSLESNLSRITLRNQAAAARERDLLDIAALAPTLTAFRIAERYLLTGNACLLRSLALQAALARRGTAASVVFGVKLHPFEAHCWVQRGTTLLNDTVERTGLFVPIRLVQ